jgi:hypothetical protein
MSTMKRMKACEDRGQESLMDVLSPPLNPWLRDLERRGPSVRVPPGVRVVRHVEGSSDGDATAAPVAPDSGHRPVA